VPGVLDVVRNPWIDLGSKPPYLLPIDAPVLASNSNVNFRFDVLPAPVVGSPDKARVWMLALNPGFAEFDVAHHAIDDDYYHQRVLALRGESRYPFWPLDPALHRTGGFLYWDRRLREVVAAVGRRRAADGLICLQYIGYCSKTYKGVPSIVPSQRYGFHLLRRAIREGALVIVLRSESLWLRAVPELRTYPHITLTNPRNPYLNCRNMRLEEFERVVHALET
jgi:hypothetical protein